MGRTVAALILVLAAPAGAQEIEELFEELVSDERAAAAPDPPDDEGLDALLEGLDPTEGVEGGEASVLRDWKGFVELRPRVYLHERDETDKNDEQLLFEAELELDFRFAENLSAYARPRLLVDALDGDLARHEPYEAYLTYDGEGWDLRAGQFVEDWGIADTTNPLDIVNRRDLATDFLDPDRLGELGLRYRRLWAGGETFGEPTVSLYALPVWRETLFPTEDGRFSFGSPGLPFEEDQGLEPEGSERGLYAARFQSTFQSSPLNADLQLLVAHGPERGPTAVVDPLPTPRLIPVYHGARTFGLGVRAVPNEDALGHFLATLTLKAEVVYKDPFGLDASSFDAPEDYLAYVLGVDRVFYGLFTDQDQLTATVEYAGEDGADDAASVFRPFANDLILRGFWEANDFARRSFELRGLWDLDTDELVLESIFETQLRSIHEDLQLRVQFQFFDLADTGDSLFDFFPNNTSLAAGLRWDL